MEVSPKSIPKAEGRSRSPMQWLLRTGMIYALAAFTLTSCTAVGCGGCGACQWLCRNWNKIFACEEICLAKIKFVDEQGQDLTGVSGSGPGGSGLVELAFYNHVTGETIFSGTLEIGADGISQEVTLPRCYNPCWDDLNTGEWSIDIFFIDVRTQDASCGFGLCRRWGIASQGGISAAGLNSATCSIIVLMPLKKGNCTPC